MSRSKPTNLTQRLQAHFLFVGRCRENITSQRLPEELMHQVRMCSWYTWHCGGTHSAVLSRYGLVSVGEQWEHLWNMSVYSYSIDTMWQVIEQWEQLQYRHHVTSYRAVRAPATHVNVQLQYRHHVTSYRAVRAPVTHVNVQLQYRHHVTSYRAVRAPATHVNIQLQNRYSIFFHL